MTALGTFVLAMLLHPEVQRKAHEELDSVVGSDRLPEYEDEPNLPYITAIHREATRCAYVTLLCADANQTCSG